MMQRPMTPEENNYVMSIIEDIVKRIHHLILYPQVINGIVAYNKLTKYRGGHILWNNVQELKSANRLHVFEIASITAIGSRYTHAKH